MGHREHQSAAPASVGCAVVTVSDTRTPETDKSGAIARALLHQAGHRVVASAIVPDEPDRVRAQVLAFLGRDDVQAVILNGGTGISPRDRTYEAVASILERVLDGFGELFRALSYQDIGAAAMLSRAIGGIVQGRAVFSIPGSPAAVHLAMEKLILPELGHIVAEARRTR